MKERLRRLELYGPDKSHPSDDPLRAQAHVLVFHVADVEQLDAQATQILEELLSEYIVSWRLSYPRSSQPAFHHPLFTTRSYPPARSCAHTILRTAA